MKLDGKTKTAHLNLVLKIVQDMDYVLVVNVNAGMIG